MAIDFKCLNCGKKLQAKFEHGGRKTSCPNCQNKVTVPLPPEETHIVDEPPKDFPNTPDISDQEQVELNEGSSPYDTPETENVSDKNSFGIEKFGLGFLVNPKAFLSGPIYEYRNEDFPALAAAVRYYAFISRLGYYLGIALTALATIVFVVTFALFFVFAISRGEVAQAFGAILAGVLYFFIGMILLLLCNLGLVISLASCEVIRVLLKIELNTRD